MDTSERSACRESREHNADFLSLTKHYKTQAKHEGWEGGIRGKKGGERSIEGAVMTSHAGSYKLGHV
jgi:hypothetical protein